MEKEGETYRQLRKKEKGREPKKHNNKHLQCTSATGLFRLFRIVIHLYQYQFIRFDMWVDF